MQEPNALPHLKMVQITKFSHKRVTKLNETLFFNKRNLPTFRSSVSSNSKAEKLKKKKIILENEENFRKICLLIVFIFKKFHDGRSVTLDLYYVSPTILLVIIF